MPKTVLNEQISWKEFFKRWKRGIDGVTVIQQTKMQIQSTYIMLLGMILGIIFCSFAFNKMWWIVIILIGGFVNTIVSLISLYQKKHQLEYFEDIKMEVIKNV